MSRDKAQSTLGMMDREWDCWKGARGGGVRQRERTGGWDWGRGLYEVDVDDLKEDESSRASYGHRVAGQGL